MECIELVIKIPKEIQLALINNLQLSTDQQSICDSYIKQAIINGKLLPKGSERLINADELARRIAGHSDYHGDNILSAIYCMAEGKHSDEPIKPLKKFEENMIQVNNLSVIHVS